MAYIATFNHQSVSDAYVVRSATVDFVSSQWASVKNRAHYTVNAEGIPILVDARPTRIATSDVENQTGRPIQNIEPSCLSPFADKATLPPVVQTNVKKLDKSRLLPFEHQSSSAAAPHTPVRIVKKLDSLLLSVFEQPKIGPAINEVTPIYKKPIDHKLVVEFDQQVVITENNTNSVSVDQSNIEPQIPPTTDLDHIDSPNIAEEKEMKDSFQLVNDEHQHFVQSLQQPDEITDPSVAVIRPARGPRTRRPRRLEALRKLGELQHRDELNALISYKEIDPPLNRTNRPNRGYAQLASLLEVSWGQVKKDLYKEAEWQLSPDGFLFKPYTSL